MSSKNKAQVIIDGKIYTLGGYESEEYLQRVAAYLNGRISELQNLEGYHRMSVELKGMLLNLNTADDYFKMKKKVDELEQELSQKDREIYEFKHDLISAQIKLENSENNFRSLEEKNAALQNEVIRLEAQIKNQNNG